MDNKKKFKFRLRTSKNRKKLREFNIDQWEFILKLKGIKYRIEKEKRLKKTKFYEDPEKKEKSYIETEVIENKIKTWKFLNFSELKLWSVLYNLWIDIEFYFRFTKYKDLFAKDSNEGILNVADTFDQNSENAFLYDADNLAAFIESSEEAENDPDYDEFDEFNEPDDFVQTDEEHMDINTYLIILCIFFFEIFFADTAPWFWIFYSFYTSFYEHIKVEEDEGTDAGEIGIENVYNDNMDLAGYHTSVNKKPIYNVEDYDTLYFLNCSPYNFCKFYYDKLKKK